MNPLDENYVVTIIVNGTVIRQYQGDYYQLHASEWDERVQAALDAAQDARHEGMA